MATTAEYLTELAAQRDALAENLVAKGVENVPENATFNELVPKVLEIPSGIKKVSGSFVAGGGETSKSISFADIGTLKYMVVMKPHLVDGEVNLVNNWVTIAVVGFTANAIFGDMTIHINSRPDLVINDSDYTQTRNMSGFRYATGATDVYGDTRNSVLTEVTQTSCKVNWGSYGLKGGVTYDFTVYALD